MVSNVSALLIDQVGYDYTSLMITQSSSEGGDGVPKSILKYVTFLQQMTEN